MPHFLVGSLLTSGYLKEAPGASWHEVCCGAKVTRCGALGKVF